MRLFIALQLSSEVRREIENIQRKFKRRGIKGNYTKPENLHLTLAFIGEYAEPDRVLEILDAVPLRPFSIALEGVGAFGDLWWVGLEPCEALETYVRRLRRSLSQAGVPFDRKRFNPHITLIRRAVCGPVGMPGVNVHRAEMTVSCASLMRSERGKNGMIYTELG